MAKAKGTTTTTEVAVWDDELAAMAGVAAKEVASSLGGQFISIRSGGIMYFGGKSVPGNQIATVVAAHTHEHAYYTQAFDENSPAAPTCFAFGTEEADMVPHEMSAAPQSEKCATCPRNKFPSKQEILEMEKAAKKTGARVRRGKECKNLMRLALLPAGTLEGKKFTPIEDPAHYDNATPAYLRVSVTSVRNFAQFVTAMATILKRPPCGVFTRLYAEPDQKNQSVTLFEQIGPVNTKSGLPFPIGNELMSKILPRHKDLMKTIGFPYQGSSVDEESPAASAPKRSKFSK